MPRISAAMPELAWLSMTEQTRVIAGGADANGRRRRAPDSGRRRLDGPACSPRAETKLRPGRSNPNPSHFIR
jgi:hypothetical protein